MEAPMIVTIVVALITAVIGPTLLELLRSRLKKKEAETTSDEALYKEIEIDEAINEQLLFLLKHLECDRVWVTQFHNGGHYYSSNVSIKKFSVFYEHTSAGVSRIQQQFQNVPVSFFSKSLKELYEIGELCVNDINDEAHHAYGLRDTAKNTGCQSILMISLKTPNGKFHGSLGIEHVKETYTFTEKEKEIARETAAFVSGTLSIIHSK